MKIVIVGAGEVGAYLSERLSMAGHNVTVIERNEDQAAALNDQVDARVFEANGATAEALLKAGIEDCDFFMAMTSSDETNIVAASLAKAMGAKTTFARVHDTTYRGNRIINYQEHFRVDHFINPEGLAAVELAKLIRNPGRVAVEDFGRGKIEVKSVVVEEKTPLVGKVLRDVKFPLNVRIGLIVRGENTEVAGPESTIEVGDQVTLFGSPDALYEARGLFSSSQRRRSATLVSLMGGGEITISLARLLSGSSFKLRIFEEDLARCRILAERFPEVSVVHGNASSRRLLQEEEIGLSDYFIAASKDDESNIMTCLQAHKLGVKRAMLVMNRADYFGVLDSLREPLGIAHAVSPRVAAADEIMRYIGTKPYIEIGQGDAEACCIIELKIGKKSDVTGKRIRDIKLPSHCVLVGLEHNYDPKTPTGDDVLEAGDLVVAIIGKPHIDALVMMTQ